MRWPITPNVAKAGGLQSQGAKGAAVVVYCKPLATPDMKSSGIQGWDDKAARRTVQSRTNIPTGCARGELTDYAMFGFDGDNLVINKKIAGNLKKPIPKGCIAKAVRVIE
jgi:hypothetical protein